MSEINSHWAAQSERGNRLFLNVTIFMVRYLPANVLKLCIGLVVLYFYATSPQQRQNIATYQRRLRETFPDAFEQPKFTIFQQFWAFGEAICDRFAVWQHQIRYEDLTIDDPDNLTDEKQNNPRGQIFACSHFGNTEVCRALVSHHKLFKLNVLVHSKHAKIFNEALQQVGADDIQLIQVSDLDAATMLTLSQKIERGEWLAIAADRVPIRGEKTINVQFLGETAPLPQGAWLLAALLKTQINTLFCVKIGAKYHLKLRKFADTSDWKRTERAEKVAVAAQQFASQLADECRQNPLQWFNFYDFWKKNND